MARLSASGREELPSSVFVGPGRSYPIDTEERARNAIARVKQFGTPELQRQVIEAVKRRYPNIDVQATPGKTVDRDRVDPVRMGGPRPLRRRR